VVAKSNSELDSDSADKSLASTLTVRRIQSSYRQVADQIQDLIISGDLVAGQRLPSEAEMIPLFGVSRSTIREALRILATSGLVSTRRGVNGGTFVAELDGSRVEGALNSAFETLALTKKVGAQDFLTAWMAIEGPSARLAAQRKGGELLAELELTSRAPRIDSSRAERLKQSSNFHFAVLSASNNLLLEAMGRPVSVVARSRFSSTTPGEEFWKSNSDEHRRIYEAIASGDEDAAEEESKGHIMNLRKYYGDALQS